MLERYDRIVECTDGHLFTSIVIPGVSLKAVRLGNKRWQRCPVGKHWTTVRRVDPSTLTPEQSAAARAVHDIRIP
ncbi:MAG: hypothetical protein ACYCU7_13085 [Acidimicrobiales bacterium]